MLKIWMCRRRGSSLVHDFLRWRSDRLGTRAKPARARARVLCAEGGWIIWTPSPSRDPCQLLFWITVWRRCFPGKRIEASVVRAVWTLRLPINPPSSALSLSPPPCFSSLPRPLYTVMEVMCGQELRMDNQAAAMSTIITAAHLFLSFYMSCRAILPCSFCHYLSHLQCSTPQQYDYF